MINKGALNSGLLDADVKTYFAESNLQAIHKMGLQFKNQVTEKTREEQLFLVQSSGSSSLNPKWVALSEDSFLSAAHQVNHFFNITSHHVWGAALPFFHVGGLSIIARAYLNKAKVFSYQGVWSAARFLEFIWQNKVTHISLVPTQVYDLIKNQIKPPSCVECVFVGGAALPQSLWLENQKLGWPLVLTYGMTETSAMCAYRLFCDRGYQWIGKISGYVNLENKLFIKTPGLFKYYLSEETLIFKENATQLIWSKVQTDEQGYWQSPDHAQDDQQNNGFIILGRDSDYIKIKGEGIYLNDLRQRFLAFIRLEFLNDTRFLDHVGLEPVIVNCHHLRNENTLFWVIENHDTCQKAAITATELWNQKCLKHEQFILVNTQTIPKNDIGKILWEKVRQHICSLDPRAY